MYKRQVQEFVPGDDDALVGYLAFWDADGREHSWLTKQKLRQYPRLIGDGSFQASVIAPEVADLSRTLLRKFAYRGLVAVEFKHDCRDETYRLMEINPRTVSCNQLAIRAGVDFPWIVYQHLVHPGEPTAPTNSFRSGVKFVNEDWDFRAYRERRRDGDLTFWRWIRSLAGARAWAVVTPRDPRPFLSQVRAQLQSSFRKVRPTHGAAQLRPREPCARQGAREP